MKSTVKNIVYTNAKGETKNRKVFVMSENDDYIRGFDLTLLTKEQVKELKTNLKGHQVKDLTFKGATPSDKPRTEVSKAIRTFKKVNIVSTSPIKDFFENFGM